MFRSQELGDAKGHYIGLEERGSSIRTGCTNRREHCLEDRPKLPSHCLQYQTLGRDEKEQG